MAPPNSSGIKVHGGPIAETDEITGDTLARAMSGTVNLTNIKSLAQAALR
jgi:hypothetical protein